MVTAVAEAAELPKTAWRRHRGPVTGVVLIPGGPCVVTSAYDSAIGLFDLDNDRVELLGYHEHLVNRVVGNRDGSKVASCSSDYSISIWDVATRRRERVLLGHSDDVEDFTFVDERTGVSASRDRRLIVWDLETGAIRRILDGHEKDVLAVVAAGRTIYSSGDDKTLRAWDVDSGRQIGHWGPFENETDTCAIDPERGRAVLGCDDGCIRIFDVATGALLQTIEAHASGIKKVAISPINGDLLSAAYDQRIVVWDNQTYRPKVEIERHPATWERSLTWSDDGRNVLGGTFDGTVLVWDANTGSCLREVGVDPEEPGNGCLNEVAVAGPDEIVTVSDDGLIRLGQLSPNDAGWKLKVEPRSGRVLMNAVACSPECRLVIGGCHDHSLVMFRRTPGGLEDELKVRLDEGPVNSIRVARHAGHECELFVACYSSRIVRVSPQGSVRGRIQVHEGAVKSLRLHPERTVGVSCGADGRLLSWTFEGELLQSFLGHTAIINDVDLDPSGTRLASVSRDFTLKVFELESGRLLHSVAIGRKSLKSVCFLSEETVIIGDYWGGLVRVDLATGTWQRRVIAGNGLSSVARMGQHVAATSYDGAVYLADADLNVVQTLSAMRQKLDAVH